MLHYHVVAVAKTVYTLKISVIVTVLLLGPSGEYFAHIYDVMMFKLVVS